MDHSLSHCAATQASMTTNLETNRTLSNNPGTVWPLHYPNLLAGVLVAVLSGTLFAGVLLLGVMKLKASKGARSVATTRTDIAAVPPQVLSIDI